MSEIYENKEELYKSLFYTALGVFSSYSYGSNSIDSHSIMRLLNSANLKLTEDEKINIIKGIMSFIIEDDDKKAFLLQACMYALICYNQTSNTKNNKYLTGKEFYDSITFLKEKNNWLLTKVLVRDLAQLSDITEDDFLNNMEISNEYLPEIMYKNKKLQSSENIKLMRKINSAGVLTEKVPIDKRLENARYYVLSAAILECTPEQILKYSEKFNYDRIGSNKKILKYLLDNDNIFNAVFDPAIKNTDSRLYYIKELLNSIFENNNDMYSLIREKIEPNSKVAIFLSYGPRYSKSWVTNQVKISFGSLEVNKIIDDLLSDNDIIKYLESIGEDVSELKNVYTNLYAIADTYKPCPSDSVLRDLRILNNGLLPPLSTNSKTEVIKRYFEALRTLINLK